MSRVSIQMNSFKTPVSRSSRTYWTWDQRAFSAGIFTADAVTPVPGQVIHLVGFTLLYLLIGFSTVWMWSRQVRATERDEGPPAALRAWALGDEP